MVNKNTRSYIKKVEKKCSSSSLVIGSSLVKKTDSTSEVGLVLISNERSVSKMELVLILFKRLIL